MSAKYRIPVPFFHFWPKLTHPAARSLCNNRATLIIVIIIIIIQPSFLRRKMAGDGRPLLPEILDQPAPVGVKSPILNR